MKTSRLLLLLSLISLGFLGIGTLLAQNDMIFWFASGDRSYQIIRLGLGALLLVQLLTRPPRHVFMRLLSGSAGLTIGTWALAQTWSGQMPLLDTMVFIGSALTTLITALEYRAAAAKQPLLGRRPATV